MSVRLSICLSHSQCAVAFYCDLLPRCYAGVVFAVIVLQCLLCLQCFDAVGWAAGRAPPACKKTEWWGAGVVVVPAHPGSPGQRAVKRVCVCAVLLSVCYKLALYRNDWMNRTGIWREGFLPPIPHCVVRKFGYLQNWVLPSGTLSQTPDVENFAASSRSRCQQPVVVDGGRVCWRHLYDSRRVMAVDYKSISWNPLSPFSLLWICRTTCYYSWQHFWLWDSALCGPSTVAEFLVLFAVIYCTLSPTVELRRRWRWRCWTICLTVTLRPAPISVALAGMARRN